MAFSAAKSIVSASARLLSTARNGSAVIGSRFGASVCLQGDQAHRSLTRSLWHMCNSKPNDVGTHPVVKPAAFTKSCGCCGLHTQGDKELAEFLSEEIAQERKNDKTPGKLPQIQGFNLESDDAEIAFTKSTDNEIVKVKFSVNDSVADEAPFDYENPEAERQNTQLVARPPFVVEINKGGDLTLCIQCNFTESGGDALDNPTPQEGQAEDQFVDVINIQDVALVRGEWQDKSYTVNASVMDENLYDMLMIMLEERGIDGDFIDRLVEFSTTYEHKKYIQFLEQLKDFALSK